MRHRRLAILMTCCLATGFAVADDAPAGKDTKELQGEWKVVEFEREGEKLTDSVKNVSITIKGDEMTLRDANDGKARKSKFKVISSSSPKGIDVIPDYGVFKSQQLAGIYTLESDRLKICIMDRGDRKRDVKNRPKDFKTETGDALGLITLERVKPK